MDTWLCILLLLLTGSLHESSLSTPTLDNTLMSESDVTSSLQTPSNTAIIYSPRTAVMVKPVLTPATPAITKLSSLHSTAFTPQATTTSHLTVEISTITGATFIREERTLSRQVPEATTAFTYSERTTVNTTAETSIATTSSEKSTSSVNPDTSIFTINPGTSTTTAPETSTSTVNLDTSTTIITAQTTTSTITLETSTPTINPNTSSSTITTETSTSTTTPETSTPTINPNTSSTTITTEISTTTITPETSTTTVSSETSTSTVNPNTSSATITTETSTSATTPETSTSTINPNISSTTITTETSTSTTTPETSTSTINPDTSTTTITPETSTTTVSSETSTSTVNPNTSSATITTETSTSTVNPNTSSATITTETSTSTTTPEKSTSTINPDTSTTITTPETSTPTINPNTSSATITTETSTSTTTPEKSTSTINPDTSTTTITPETSTTTISSETSTSTVNPNTSSATITTETSTSTTTPETFTSTINPNTSSATITAETSTSTTTPETSTSTINPDTSTTTITPETSTTTISSETSTSTVNPNTSSATITTETSTSTTTPETFTSTINPNTSSATITAETSTSTTTPETSTSTINPDTSTTTITPETSTTTVSSETSTSTVNPNTSSATITTETSTSATTPETSTSTINPDTSTTTITPETSTTTVSSETSTSTVNPNTSSATITTETSTSTVNPNTSSATITTETSTSTTTPEKSTSTINPDTSTTTTTPETSTPTINPNTSSTTITTEISTTTITPDTSTTTISSETSTSTVNPNTSLATITTDTILNATTPKELTNPTSPITFTNATIPEIITNTTASMTTKIPTIVTTATTTTTALNCMNGGSLENGVCICQDMWIGETCETENFCTEQIFNKLNFGAAVVGQFSYSKELCQSSINDGIPKASARCLIINGSIKFDDFQIFHCNLTLSEIQQSINGTENMKDLAAKTQILTSRPEMMSAENVSIATQIATTILTSRPTQEVAIAAVTTVSQLLNAEDDKFTTPSSNGSTESLTAALQKFSVQTSYNTLMVQPNLAVQSAIVSGANGKGVQFSLIGDPSSFVPNRIHFNPNASQLTVNSSGAVQIFIQFPSGQSHKTTSSSVGFVLYQNDKLFRSKAFTSELGTSRRVISGRLSGESIPNHVEISFKPENVPNASLSSFACVFWNYTLDDWSSYGCSGKKDSLGHLLCRCNHTTNFALLMSFRMNYVYVDALKNITYVGCSLSITGLSLTIIYQIATRKSRRSKPTMLLVSICMSLLIFYLLFIFGITNSSSSVESFESSNEMPTSDLHILRDSGCCTVFTVLLQYFLLATFTWTTAFSTEIFLLLRNTFNQLPQHFTTIVTVTGWGFPAIVVAVTLGATYRVDNPLGYRQEEFCWLAALDRENNFDVRKPMLWGFLLPVALMLIFNMGILVYFAVTTCRTNHQLQSTQKTSILKRFLSSLSLAVLLSITWIIGYLLLVKDSDILAIIFCVLNTTQGLQIFILFTARTSTFKTNVQRVLRFFSHAEIPLHYEKFSMRIHREKGSEETYKKIDLDSTISSSA